MTRIGLRLWQVSGCLQGLSRKQGLGWGDRPLSQGKPLSKDLAHPAVPDPTEPLI